MADGQGNINWYNPDVRAIIPLERALPNTRFRRWMKSSSLRCTVDQHFRKVMEHCATAHGESWISNDLIEAYTALHRIGYAHSVETWLEEELVGGIYGVSIGAAFFGESMFSSVPNASKAAFYTLMEHLRRQCITLFDTQFLNNHTASLGAIEIPKHHFIQRLDQARCSTVRF